MKLKALLASFLLGSAGFVGTVNAAIDFPLSSTSIDNSAAGSGSELIFFATTATQSYSRDLGIDFNGINDTSILSFDADSALSSILGDITSWGVVAFDNASNGASTTDASEWGYRLLGTSTAGPTVAGNGELGSINRASPGWFSGLNGQTGHSSAADGSDLVGSTDDGSVQEITGADLSGSFGGDAGSSLAFYLYGEVGNLTTNPLTGLSFEASGLTSTLLGQWNLGSNGTLSFNGVNPIPVPAAVWLMGSALVGLVGIRRRKQS